MPELPAVDRLAGPVQPSQPAPFHPDEVDVVLGDLGTERANRGERRLGVGRAAEARDRRLALANRAEEHRSV